MIKAITVPGADGEEKNILLKTSASIPRLYRKMFNRDIILDMNAISNAMTDAQDEGFSDLSSLPPEILELFENIAYIMAKHANPSISDDMDTWLDNYSMFSIYQIFPTIAEMWRNDNVTLSKNDSKKK